MGKRRLDRPLGSIENARRYLEGLWETWSPESRRAAQACGEVTVAMLIAVDDHRTYVALLDEMRKLAAKMRALDPKLAVSFLRNDLPSPNMGAFPQAFWAAELIVRDPLSVAYDNLAFALLNDICELAETARQDRKIVLAYVAGYTSLVSELRMPSPNQLAALSVIFGIEKPTSDGHDRRFGQWTTARKSALKKMKAVGIPFPNGRLNA